MENAGRGRGPWSRRAGFVYFIQAEALGLIKIGSAVDPTDRLCTLRCGSPDQLTLLAIIRSPQAVGVERGLHHQFRASRSHGEWFHPSAGLLAFIAAEAEDYEEMLSRENRELLNETPMQQLAKTAAS